MIHETMMTMNSNVRPLAAERLAAQLPSPCRNQAHGCGLRLAWAERQRHEAEVLLSAADSVTYLRAMTGEAAGWQPTTTTPGLVAFTAAASPDTSPPPPTATNRNCMSGT